jgi:hypothetical protein
MQHGHSTTIRGSAVYLTIFILLSLVYFFDMQTPVGMTPWVFYMIPLGLTYLAPHVYAPLIVATTCVVLVFVGLVTSLPGVPEQMALANRSFGSLMFWITAVFIGRYKELTNQLHQAMDQLAADLRERTRDLGRAVRDLQREIDVRTRAEQGVRDAWIEMERRVAERTQTLAMVNASLLEKIGLLESSGLPARGQTTSMDEAKADLARLERELKKLHAAQDPTEPR